MTERIIFACKPDSADGKATLVVLQAPGSDRIALGIEAGETAVSVVLTAEAAIGLASQLMAANLENLARLASVLPEQLASELGAALLVAPASAALLREVAEDEVPN